MQRPALLLALLLCISVAAVARQAPPEPQKKQITDTAEYNAYVAAINEQAPARKIQLLDEFLAKYPGTVMKEEALELKLVAQQQAGQPFEPTARRLLEVSPNNAQALLVLNFLFANTPLSEQDPQYQQKVSDAETLARRGLEQLATLARPETMSEADYVKLKNFRGATFHQVIGLIGRYRKDLPLAQAELKKAAELSPEDAAAFVDLFPCHKMDL